MVNTLSAPGLPTFTYTPDAEGRINTISASSGQNPVTTTSYNGFGEPTGVTFGSGDADAFSYDPNTGRMTQYKYTVNSSSAVGNLTWNANGSLKTLSITDPFNSSNAQTCNYGYDDLGRVASANCGSIWSQTFNFDAFGNITKSGTIAFQPTYSSATNRFATLPGLTPTYDANGNLTHDGYHTYSWDAEGRPVSIDTVTVIYDALGRWVEHGTSPQMVYDATGYPLGLMAGQTLSEARVPLSAGAKAVYNPALSAYWHPDWLGSERLRSSPSRTVIFDTAYAPYGETYASQPSGAEPSFTGQYQDVAVDMFDFPFREYHPTQGRWISPDPLGGDVFNPQSLNRYAYVLNSPTSLTDPLGLVRIPRGGESGGGFIGGCELWGVFQDPVTEGTSLECLISGPSPVVGGPVLPPDGGGGGSSSAPPAAKPPFRPPARPTTFIGPAPPPPPPPDNRPTCGSVLLNDLFGTTSSPTGEVVEQGAKAASTAAAAQALKHEVERGLVVPLRSSTVRLFVTASELLGFVAEVAPLGFGIYEVGKADLATFEANRSGACRPGF